MPGIFISYRREDSIAHTGRLYDRLVVRFGAERVFMDIDTLDFGVDFVDAIQQTVASCDVLIAVIGRQWLDSKDDTGRRRLDNPEDFVRVEIEAALERDVRVIPILVGGARMPHSSDLPDAINKLARRNALDISDMHLRESVGRLLISLEKLLATADQRRLAEEEKARLEAEQRRLAEEEKARLEAERRRLAEEKARVEADQRRLAEEKARAEADQYHLSEEDKPLAEIDDGARAGNEVELLPAGPEPEQKDTSTVITILDEYRSREFHVAPEIPARILSAACRSCEVPEFESMLAVLDCSGIGTAAQAIAFAADVLYYRTDTQKGSLKYISLPGDEERITVWGGGLSFEVSGSVKNISLRRSSISAGLLARLLIQLKRVSSTVSVTSNA